VNTYTEPLPRTPLPVTPLTGREAALRADDSLYIPPASAERIGQATAQWATPWSLERVREGLLADMHEQLEVGTRVTRIAEWIGDCTWMGERWQVYAEVSTRTPRIMRYVAYPIATDYIENAVAAYTASVEAVTR
jgi:hypothetical protein